MRIASGPMLAFIILTVSSISSGYAAGLPAGSSHTCYVRTFGAKGDGSTKDTVAIQKAIDACAARGNGSVVELRNGTFVSGPLLLKSNITLRVDPGATLLGSPDHADFPRKQEFRGPGYQAFIGAVNAENVTITGGGVIDGNGASWWKEARQYKNSGILGSEHTRPRGVVFDHCKHVKIEHVTIQNSPYWQVVPYYTDDVTIRDVKILADPHSPNTDAIDPFSSTNVLIEHVTSDVGDDNIAIKSGMINSPGPDAPTRNVRIRDCTFLHGHGLSIGSEIAGGAQNITAERITFRGTDNGLRIKANRDRGADVSGIVMKDITMQYVKTAVLVSEYYPKVFPTGTVEPAPVGRLTPLFHDITFENIRATGSKQAGVIVGLPEAPVKNLVLKNVSIQAQTGMRIAYAHVKFENVTVKAAEGESIIVSPTATIEGK